MTPTDRKDHEPRVPKRSYKGTRALAWILGHSFRHSAALVVVGLLGVVIAGARYTRAWLAQPIIDRVIVPAAAGDISLEPLRPVLVEIGILAGLTLIATPLAILGRGYAAEWISARVRQDIDVAVARKLLHLPLRVLRQGPTGDFLARALADLRIACDLVAIVYRDIALFTVLIIGGLAMTFWISWQLTLMTLLSIPPFAAVVILMTVKSRPIVEKRQAAQGDLSAQLLAILSGIKVVKAFRGEEVESQAFAHQTDEYFKRHMKIMRNGAIMKSSTEVMYPLVAGTVFGAGIYFISNDLFGLTAGSLTTFGIVLSTLYKPVKNSMRLYPRMIEAAGSAERVIELLALDEETKDVEGAQPMPARFDHLVFRDVGFDFGDGDVLSEIDLDISAGEVIAIVGRSGAGKSTLAELLLRFHDPTRGAIEIDGIDIRNMQRRSFLNRVALVTQEPFLFDDTIAANIRYGRPGASDEEVEAAAKAAAAHDFITALPDGYETVAGEFGQRLSGGQRQRITIARALISEAAIFVFDEATSALDSQTESVVQDAIDELRGERTVLVVAHRLSTIERADRIVVLDEGRIAEIGDHATLLEQGGIYASMLRGTELRESA